MGANPGRVEESPAVDDLLCFALYAASRAVTARYRPMLEPLGLTYPQYLVLLALYEHGSLSVRDLGEALRLDSGTLSPLLKRLADAGLVTRTRSSADERSVVVSLTARGKRLRPKVVAVRERICESLAGFDLDRLTDELHALTATLDTTREQPPSGRERRANRRPGNQVVHN